MQTPIRYFLGVLLVSSFGLIGPHYALADCICIPQQAQAFDSYDSTGEKIQPEAYGLWTDVQGKKPQCPTDSSPYGPGVRSRPKVGLPCNVYTQWVFRVAPRVPSLHYVTGHFYPGLAIAVGIYACINLLLGLYIRMRSGQDDNQKLIARKRIKRGVIILPILLVCLVCIVILEQFVFGGQGCLGFSCPMSPSLPHL